MSKIKIALVSYINTIPFIKAIQSSEALKDKIELIIDYPAKCAELIKLGQVDGGLIPVGALDEAKNYKIISDYCIGANGAVDTVVLFSNQPFEEINSIYLDYQSRTSVRLVQVLAEKYWKREFEFLPTQQGFEDNIPENSAILMIGDRVFNYSDKYAYKVDLAENWKQFTKLPFAFAVWVGNKKMQSIEKELNKIFKKQLSDIPSCYNKKLTIDKDLFINYLEKKIDYSLDNRKKEAIQLFTSLLTNR